ncbi:MAG: hypothetical protein ACJAV2_004507, partial [Myxococcota bacterium]
HPPTREVFAGVLLFEGGTNLSGPTVVDGQGLHGSIA